MIPLIIFGTMEDIEELIAEGKETGHFHHHGPGGQPLPSHHEWFKSLEVDPMDLMRITFIHRKTRNPTTAVTLRQCSEPGSGTNKYYLHSFHKDQPDLNWQNPVLLKNLQDDQLVVGQGNSGLSDRRYYQHFDKKI